MKQFPDFLKEYETALQKYRQRSVEILAEPLNDGEITDIKSSKFLGMPYLPVGTDYPKDKDGKPLILWAQLNFSEIPHLDDYPKNGIMQFFVSADGWYDCEYGASTVCSLKKQKNTAVPKISGAAVCSTEKTRGIFMIRLNLPKKKHLMIYFTTLGTR